MNAKESNVIGVKKILNDFQVYSTMDENVPTTYGGTHINQVYYSHKTETKIYESILTYHKPILPDVTAQLSSAFLNLSDGSCENVRRASKVLQQTICHSKVTRNVNSCRPLPPIEKNIKINHITSKAHLKNHQKEPHYVEYDD